MNVKSNKYKYYAIIVSSLMVVSVGFSQYYLWVAEENARNRFDLRSLRIEKLNLSRSIQSLLAHQLDLKVEAQQPVSTQSLKLSLLEMFEKLSQENIISVEELRIDEVETGPGSSDINTLLQLQFSVVLAHAVNAIRLFGRLELLAGWRLFEPRRCTLVREQKDSQLLLSCTVHVFHWPMEA